VVHHNSNSSGYGGPHTAQPVAKIDKIKDLALILLIGVFRLPRAFSFLTEDDDLLSKSIVMLHFEIFIVSGKSRCGNGTFAIYIAASEEYLIRRKIIFRCVESTFHSDVI